MKSASPWERLLGKAPKLRRGGMLDFVTQMYTQGGARIRTPEMGSPLMETVIQPDCDVVTRVWGDPEKWEEREKTTWKEHDRRVRSKIDGLRQARLFLEKARYVSIVPAIGELWELLKGPTGWEWSLVFLWGVLVLLFFFARMLAGLLLRLWLKRAASALANKERKRPVRFYVSYPDAEAPGLALKLDGELRQAGIASKVAVDNRTLEAQLSQADALGFSHVVVLGEEEMKGGSSRVRDLASGSDEELTEQAIRRLKR